MALHDSYIIIIYIKKEIYKTSKINYQPSDMKKDLKRLQEEYTWLKDVDGSILRTALDDLNNAYDRFFKGIGKYPKFKKKSINGSYRTI